MVDRAGKPLQSLGLSASARDPARFGRMAPSGGKFNGQRVLSAAAIADMTRGGDRQKFKSSGMTLRPSYKYRN